jgi:hypothetical protein
MELPYSGWTGDMPRCVAASPSAAARDELAASSVARPDGIT